MKIHLLYIKYLKSSYQIAKKIAIDEVYKMLVLCYIVFVENWPLNLKYVK